MSAVTTTNSELLLMTSNREVVSHDITTYKIIKSQSESFGNRNQCDINTSLSREKSRNGLKHSPQNIRNKKYNSNESESTKRSSDSAVQSLSSERIQRMESNDDSSKGSTVSSKRTVHRYVLRTSGGQRPHHLPYGAQVVHPNDYNTKKLKDQMNTSQEKAVFKESVGSSVSSLGVKAQLPSPSVLPKSPPITTTRNAAECGTLTPKWKNSSTIQDISSVKSFQSIARFNSNAESIPSDGSSMYSAQSFRSEPHATVPFSGSYESGLRLKKWNGGDNTARRIGSVDSAAVSNEVHLRPRKGFRQLLTRNPMSDQTMLEMLDKVALQCASGMEFSFGWILEQISSRNGAHRVAIVTLCNFLSAESVKQYQDTKKRLEKVFPGELSIILIGSGPAKFIPSFCFRSGIVNSTPSFFEPIPESVKVSCDEDSSARNRSIYVCSDSDRNLYSIVTMYKASHVKQHHQQNVPSSSSASKIASNFSLYSQIVEAATKGPKYQYLAMMVLDIKTNQICTVELDVNSKYKFG